MVLELLELIGTVCSDQEFGETEQKIASIQDSLDECRLNLIAKESELKRMRVEKSRKRVSKLRVIMQRSGCCN